MCMQPQQSFCLNASLDPFKMYQLGQEAFPLSNTEWAPCVRVAAQVTSSLGKWIYCLNPSP